MAIGAITVQATLLSAFGYIKINKRGKGDPVSLDKGDNATFTYEQGGGANQLAQGEWVKVRITGSSPNYSAHPDHNLAVHDCPVDDRKKSKLKEPLGGKKGLIVVKHPDQIARHPLSGSGTIPVATGEPDVGVHGDFVTFDEVGGKAKNVAKHTCPHPGGN